MTAGQIVAFWTASGRKRWFAKDAAFDAEIRERFEGLHHRAARRELDDWEDTAEGALALLLLLDQVPRNIYRGSAHAFATDPLARAVAKRVLGLHLDAAFDSSLRNFFYTPLEHSEYLEDQELCVRLCEGLGDPDLLKWAMLHRDIILRFGRFPHRNTCLGRTNTPEETAFLQSGGFAG
jgi:uncharacterized protein (DUF924 family)